MRPLQYSSPALWMLAGAAIFFYSIDSGAAQKRPPHKHSDQTLNFDGQTVEALSRRHLDSLDQFGQADRSRGDHLYSERTSFDAEIRKDVEALRYEP